MLRVVTVLFDCPMFLQQLTLKRVLLLFTFDLRKSFLSFSAAAITRSIKDYAEGCPVERLQEKSAASFKTNQLIVNCFVTSFWHIVVLLYRSLACLSLYFDWFSHFHCCFTFIPTLGSLIYSRSGRLPDCTADYNIFT